MTNDAVFRDVINNLKSTADNKASNLIVLFWVGRKMYLASIQHCSYSVPVKYGRLPLSSTILLSTPNQRQIQFDFFVSPCPSSQKKDYWLAQMVLRVLGQSHTYLYNCSYIWHRSSSMTLTEQWIQPNLWAHHFTRETLYLLLHILVCVPPPSTSHTHLFSPLPYVGWCTHPYMKEVTTNE